MPTYQPLPTEYAKNGYQYTQLQRTEHVALYRQACAECPTFCAYEVCRIQRQEAGTRTLGGATIEVVAKELLPGSEMWGEKGWTYRTLATAEAKFQQQHELLTAKIAA